MSAHPASQRRGFLSAAVAQLSAYVLDPVEPTVGPEPLELEPYPVVAVVSAAPHSGATSVARMLAAELAARADGAAVVLARSHAGRRSAPPARAASRVAIAIAGAATAAHAVGRLCLVADADLRRVVPAAHYLAPVVIDVAPDGSALDAARCARRAVVVAGASGEPALAGAVARVLGGDPVRVVNRVADRAAWEGRADVFVPEARIAARAAVLGIRPLGPLGDAIAELADAIGAAP
jgi:hypothetical protein